MSTPTPITDDASLHTDAFESPAKAREFARRLELDRSALMEALELAETYLIERGIATRGTTGRTVVLPKMQAALAAARANFPES
jgi:hypothetical protein